MNDSHFSFNREVILTFNIDSHFSLLKEQEKKNKHFLQEPNGDLCCIRVVQADQSPWQKLISSVVIGLDGVVTHLGQLKQKYT